MVGVATLRTRTATSSRRVGRVGIAAATAAAGAGASSWYYNRGWRKQALGQPRRNAVSPAQLEAVRTDGGGGGGLVAAVSSRPRALVVAASQKITGVVVSTSMDKTAVVEVARKSAHPKYKKVVRRTKKYLAHDEENECREGFLVTLVPMGRKYVNDRLHPHIYTYTHTHTQFCTWHIL